MRVYLRAVEAVVRLPCPGASRGTPFGAVAFVHRFGGARFHGSAGFGPEDVVAVQRRIRQRGLRSLHRHGHLDDTAVHAQEAADHAGGWSVDGSVAIAEWDRHGLERVAA